MIYSLNKIREIGNIDKKIADELLIEALNSIGFEVESVQKLGKDFKTVVGKVTKKEKHPNADRLSILDVDTKGETIKIVTSASVDHNDNLGIFLPGSVVGDKKLEPTDFRGVKSFGMLIGYNEIFDSEVVPNEWEDDVLKFDDDSLVGEDALIALDYKDTIIEIDTLPNRSDAIAHYVIAKELSAYFNINNNIDKNLFAPKKEAFKSNLKVINYKNNTLSLIEANESIKPSSLEDKIFLMKIGIKPINNIVDLTQMVWAILGQPIHAYDKDKIGDSLTIAKEPGNLMGVDNKNYEFKNSLVIKSNNKIVALAGMMGGLESSISSSTTKIVFEIANFNITDIRNSVKDAKVSSKSSITFSKKINLNLIKLTGMFIKTRLNECSNHVGLPKNKRDKVVLNIKTFNKYAGFKFFGSKKYREVLKKLKILGFKSIFNYFWAPSYRHDVNLSVDIIEEFFRFYGFNNFELNKPKTIFYDVNKIDTIKEQVASSGYNEVITYSLQNNDYNSFNPFGLEEEIKLETFSSKEREVYRNNLTLSLLKQGTYHLKRKINEFSFFEVANVGNNKNRHLCLVSTKDFLDIKEDIKNWFPNIKFKRTESDFLHKGLTSDLFINDKKVGFLGKVHPIYDNSRLFVAEIILEDNNEKQVFNKYSSDQLIVKDFNFNLKSREEIGLILNQLKGMSDIKFIKIKDRFNKDGSLIMTLRISYMNENTFNIIEQLQTKEGE